MSTLELSLGPVSPDFAQSSPPSIPVQVLDGDGAVLVSAAVSAARGRLIELPAGTQGPVFVRARLPSGERQTKRVELQGQERAQVELFDHSVSPHEWLAWSRPHIRIEQLPTLVMSLREFGNVWTRLWRRSEGNWMMVSITALHVMHEDYAAQFELQLEQAGYLLQIGGDRLPWRFVALPGGGLVRVLLTPNTSEDPRADPLRVGVSRMKPDEEMLLDYLLQDRLVEAETLAEAPGVAEKLLYEKYQDPVSACIGAYFLLRVNRLGRRLEWARNLYLHTDWLADSAIIFATELLRSGGESIETIDRVLNTALRRGVPVYLEGMKLLNDACEIMALGSFRKRHAGARRKRVEELVVAGAWAGAMTGYYGRRPEEPRPEHFVGLPGSRRKIDLFGGRLSTQSFERPTTSALAGPSERRLSHVDPQHRREGTARRQAVRSASSQDPFVFFVVRA